MKIIEKPISVPTVRKAEVIRELFGAVPDLGLTNPSAGEEVSAERNNNILFITSFGIGVPLKLWNSQLVRMDYAIDIGSVEEGLSHLFSFSLKY